jgi:hypothetical protein
LRNKSIDPLPREPEPSLEELLAREEGKPEVAGPPPGSAIMPTPPQDPPVALPPELAAIADQQIEPAPQKPTEPAKPPFDPNSIAL